MGMLTDASVHKTPCVLAREYHTVPVAPGNKAYLLDHSNQHAATTLQQQAFSDRQDTGCRF